MTKIDRDLARKVHERAKELGGLDKWGVKKKLCEEFNLSRPTLYELLKRYPIKPERKYKEFEDFYAIPQIKDFKKVVSEIKLKHILQCWLALERKNPMNWTSSDLAILRNNPTPDIKDTETGKIYYHYMVTIRKFLSRYRHDLYRKEEKNLLYTKGLKRRKGAKREWFLTPDELTRFIQVIDDVEFLTQVVCQVKWGGRHSALIYKHLTVSKITKFPSKEGNLIGLVPLYEPKTKKEWQKWIDEDTMLVLEEYVRLKKLNPNDKLFPHSLDWYNKRMKIYGMKAGLCQYQKIKYRTKKGKVRYKLNYIGGIPMSSHILRHTFAFICSINGISLEETAELGGWEDVNTLKDFYFYVPPEKLRKRYNSIDWNKPITREKMTLVASRIETPTEEELKTLERE